MQRRQRPGWRWVLASLVALTGVAAIILAAWMLPSLLYGDVSKASADARLQAASGFRTALVAGLAGLAALGSLAMATRTYRLTQQGQITDRYTKAIEQLGSEKVDVRLGGIYALERIANDSLRDRAAVADVLAAFIRGQTPWPPSRPGQYVKEAQITKVPPMRIRAPDVHAALTVLGRRQPPPSSAPVTALDLSRTDLRRMDLTGAMLDSAWLIDVQLQRSVLIGTRLRTARLENAVLKGAILHSVQLQGANLMGAQLQGASLEKVELQRAICSVNTVWPDGFDWKAAGVILTED